MATEVADGAPRTSNQVTGPAAGVRGTYTTGSRSWSCSVGCCRTDGATPTTVSQVSVSCDEVGPPLRRMRFPIGS